MQELKALEILKELLKQKYKNQPLWFGVQNSIEKIEEIHEAIQELEKLKCCQNCKFYSISECKIECKTCFAKDYTNWKVK